MTENSNENLSEVLFKPQRHSLETSFISNSVENLPNVSISNSVTDAEYQCQWFRVLHLIYWGWLGCDVIKLKSVISKIVACDAKRSRPGIVDTVYEYAKGNWIYEFSMLARDCNLKASQLESENDIESAYIWYRLAYLYYDIASYPHLKGDELANQALLQHHINYRKASSLAKGDFEEVKLTVEGKVATAFIHTPDKTKLSPCIVICSNMQNLATEYLRFYRENLYDKGIALVACDLPGIGLSSNVSLSEQTDKVHNVLLDYIKEHVPYLDNTRIGILSQRLGGNCASRILASRSEDIKCCCMVAPLLDEFFVNKELLAKTPSMVRAILCNHIGIDAAQWDNIIPQLQTYSIKKQALFSGKKVTTPIMVLGINDDYMSPKADIKLCESFGSNVESEIISLKKKETPYDLFNVFIEKTVSWFVKNL